MKNAPTLNSQFSTLHSPLTPSVPPGYKQTEVGVIPEDWEVKCLYELTTIATGNTPLTSDLSNYGDEFFFVGPVDIGTSKYISETEKKLSKKGFSSSRRFPKNSILFVSIGSTIGKCGIAPVELTSNQQINAIFPSANFSSDYLFYAVCAVSYKIKAQAGEQAVPIVNKTQFSKVRVALPPLPEQDAIAKALSDVDALLDGLDRLIAKKRDLKQATMQALLTPPERIEKGEWRIEKGEWRIENEGVKSENGKWRGETEELSRDNDGAENSQSSTLNSPFKNVRLSGFEGEWEVKRLGDHVKFLRNGVNSRAELTLDDPIKYLHYGDIHSCSSVNLTPLSLPSLPSEKAKNRDRLCDGDLVFVDASEDLVGISKSVEICGTSNTEIIAGLHTIVARFDKEILADGFKAYLQFCSVFSGQLRRLAVGTKVYSTSRSHIASVEMQLPGIEEQIAITKIFSDMNAEIKTLEKRRNKTADLKQAMMQELLTGRIRIV